LVTGAASAFAERLVVELREVVEHGTGIDAFD